MQFTICNWVFKLIDYATENEIGGQGRKKGIKETKQIKREKKKERKKKEKKKKKKQESKKKIFFFQKIKNKKEKVKFN